jgi:hypothetical protein
MMMKSNIIAVEVAARPQRYRALIALNPATRGVVEHFAARDVIRRRTSMDVSGGVATKR